MGQHRRQQGQLTASPLCRRQGSRVASHLTVNISSPNTPGLRDAGQGLPNFGTRRWRQGAQWTQCLSSSRSHPISAKPNCRYRGGSSRNGSRPQQHHAGPNGWGWTPPQRGRRPGIRRSALDRGARARGGCSTRRRWSGRRRRSGRPRSKNPRWRRSRAAHTGMIWRSVARPHRAGLPIFANAGRCEIRKPRQRRRPGQYAYPRSGGKVSGRGGPRQSAAPRASRNKCSDPTGRGFQQGTG